MFVLGVVFFPITSKIFNKFHDKGWMSSKIIGLGITGLTMFLISYIKILKFTTLNCYIIIAVFFIIGIRLFSSKKNTIHFNLNNTIKNILITEIIFCVIFIAWTYIRSYDVAIDNTTEQFMNYGFMNKIMKSEYMPPEDIWFSGHNINYYYFGQYISTFLTRISFLQVNEGYNIILALIASLTFMLPYSIAFNLGKALIKDDKNKFKSKVPYIIAILTGLSICIGGTLYYPIYRCIPKENGEPYYYWDATRYIGYRPETKDKTITDTPSYSNFAGDLHAHYIDTMFVFVILALLLAIMFNERLPSNKKRLYNLNLVFLGIFLGIQKMTNYWDFPIYTVIILVSIIANNIMKYKCSKKNVIITIIQILELAFIEELITLPFSKDLYISATEVKLTNVVSPFYKLLVLWGLPVICYISYICYFIFYLVKNKESKFINKIRFFKISDIFILVMGICALGLIILPELIYLKDIYSDEFKRANTMFKLTYQAYILFSFSTCYIIIKFIYEKGWKIKRIIVIILLIVQLSTLGYGLNAIGYELRNFNKNDMANSEIYIQNYYPDDYNAIQWIKEYIDNSDVIAECVDGSYTVSSRISVFTGNPTVLGWHGHEWIWRAEDYKSPKEENERWSDINGLYSSKDINYINNIIEKYNISYIYFGNVEYDKNYSVDALLNVGELVYENTNRYHKSPVYIIKTNN